MSRWTGYITASGVWFTLASVTEINDSWDAIGRLSATTVGIAFSIASFVTLFSKEGRDG